jgi:hypothetical protein
LVAEDWAAAEVAVEWAASGGHYGRCGVAKVLLVVVFVGFVIEQFPRRKRNAVQILNKTSWGCLSGFAAVFVVEFDAFDVLQVIASFGVPYNV